MSTLFFLHASTLYGVALCGCAQCVQVCCFDPLYHGPTRCKLGRTVIHHNTLLCCGVTPDSLCTACGAMWWWWGGQSHRPLWVRGVGHLGAAWAWEDLAGGGHHFGPHYLAWEGGGTRLTLIIRGPGKSLRQRVGGSKRTR